ncbi:hypothetical protein CHS0354_042843 [Potamilus streckersoni]|uniref:Uncharacterized protein n=1 Tax=Potamilus streckersoni TaxID=2493646 RepID=A0AAE0T590_9BIVA|nr:hypothetical protein CHS0354_042843 [Potamilus streckersoni]
MVLLKLAPYTCVLMVSTYTMPPESLIAYQNSCIAKDMSNFLTPYNSLHSREWVKWKLSNLCSSINQTVCLDLMSQYFICKASTIDRPVATSSANQIQVYIIYRNECHSNLYEILASFFTTFQSNFN